MAIELCNRISIAIICNFCDCYSLLGIGEENNKTMKISNLTYKKNKVETIAKAVAKDLVRILPTVPDKMNIDVYSLMEFAYGTPTITECEDRVEIVQYPNGLLIKDDHWEQYRSIQYVFVRMNKKGNFLIDPSFNIGKYIGWLVTPRIRTFQGLKDAMAKTTPNQEDRGILRYDIESPDFYKKWIYEIPVGGKLENIAADERHRWLSVISGEGILEFISYDNIDGRKHSVKKKRKVFQNDSQFMNWKFKFGKFSERCAIKNTAKTPMLVYVTEC